MGLSLGVRIKQRRLEIGVSLRELARRTSLTASFISQVENGKTNMSLDSMRHIAESLDVPLFYLLSDDFQIDTETTGTEAVKKEKIIERKYNPVVRSNHRPKVILPDSGVTYEKLIPDIGRKMEPFCARLAPETGNVARPLREPTEEFIYMLSGSLLIGLESGDYVLMPGDSIYFEGNDLKSLMCNSENEEAVWISVITPPVF